MAIRLAAAIATRAAGALKGAPRAMRSEKAMPEQGNTRGRLGAAALVGRGTFDAAAVGAEAIGVLHLVWSAKGLVRLGFGEPDEGERAAWGEVPEAALPPRVEGLLRRYFSGEKVDPISLAVDLRGTPFQKKVWGALRAIPRGEVRSYAHIASVIGSPRAMRAVGAANGANPIAIVVPCHRVVEAGFKLGGYSAGLDRKRALLALEGVDVDNDVVSPGQLSFLS